MATISGSISAGSGSGPYTIRWQFDNLSAAASSYSFEITTNDGYSKSWNDGTNYDSTTGHSAGYYVVGHGWATLKSNGVRYDCGTASVQTPAAPQPPSQPTGLSVSVSGYAPATITASWNASSGSPSGYNWSYSGPIYDSGAVQSPTTQKTSYSVPAGSYYYYVSAYNGNGTSSEARYGPFTVSNPPAPSQPANLTVSVSGYAPATVTASWSASSNSPTQYNWSYYPGSSGNTGAVTPPTTSKAVSGIPAGSYTWYVSASNGYGTSTEASKAFTVSAVPVPGAISGLNVTVSGYSPANISATWNAPTTGGAVTGYTWDYTGASSNSGAVTSPKKDVVGVSPAGFYDFHVTPYNASGNGPKTPYSFEVQAAPISPPTGTPSVSATPGYYGATISWTAVTGQNVIYEVWAADITLGTGYYSKTETINRTASISLDREWANYSIEVRPKNEAGYGNTGSTTVRTLDSVAPVVGTVTASNISSTTVTISVSGSYDPMPDAGNASGIRDYEYYMGTSSTSLAYYGTNVSTSMQFTGLTVNTTYYFGVLARDNNSAPNSSARKDISAKTGYSRPANWTWTTSKTSGGTFNITATEWYQFTTRINEFEDYKVVPRTSFPTYSGGSDFPASAYNTAAFAIGAISNTSFSYFYRDDDIFAYDINLLRDRLNSIT